MGASLAVPVGGSLVRTFVREQGGRQVQVDVAQGNWRMGGVAEALAAQRRGETRRNVMLRPPGRKGVSTDEDHQEVKRDAQTVAATGPTLEALRRAVADVEKGAILVPRRIMRRVIKDRYGLPRLGLRLPHELCHITDRESLLRIVDAAELGPRGGADLPERVILLPQPEAEEIDAVPVASLADPYWRLLFHCRVHLDLEERMARGRSTRANCVAGCG